MDRTFLVLAIFTACVSVIIVLFKREVEWRTITLLAILSFVSATSLPTSFPSP